MTVLEYLLSNRQKATFFYEVLEAFQLRIVPITYGKKFEVVKVD